jgi:hypothetical protein
MTRRSPVPSSPALEATARGANFRDRIAIVVKASPEAIFRALHEFHFGNADKSLWTE